MFWANHTDGKPTSIDTTLVSLSLNSKTSSSVIQGFSTPNMWLHFVCRHWFRNQACVYLIKFKNGNTKIISEICSKVIIKTPEQRQQSLSIPLANLRKLWFSDVFRRHRKQILTLFCCLFCELWTDLIHYSGVSVVNFEQVNAICD